MVKKSSGNRGITKPARPIGHPAHVPSKISKDYVREMTLAGIPQERQWERMEIGEGTYRKYYLIDYRAAFEDANRQVARVSLAKALGITRDDPEPNPEKADASLLKFWAGAHMNWTEKRETNVNANIAVHHIKKLDISSIPDDQLDVLEQALRATVLKLDGGT